jgi:hypothetical protein
MLADDAMAEVFAGGTVYQAFLDAAACPHGDEDCHGGPLDFDRERVEFYCVLTDHPNKVTFRANVWYSSSKVMQFT